MSVSNYPYLKYNYFNKVTDVNFTFTPTIQDREW